MSLDKALQISGRVDLLKVASSGAESYEFDSRDATYISCVKAHVKQADERTKEACDAHARFWRISEQVKAACEKIDNYVPAELRPEDYAMNYDGVRKYAAFDAESTFDAAIAFHENRVKYTQDMRKHAALRLLKKAEDHNVHLPAYVETYLHKAACLGFVDPANVQEALIQRLNRSMPTMTKSAAEEKLSAALSCFTEDDALCYDRDFIKSACEVLENYDAEYNLTSRYGIDVGLPEEIIGDNLTTDKLVKAAGCSAAVVKLSNGHTVDVTELTKEALDAVSDQVQAATGVDKFAEHYSELAGLTPAELAEVLPTLPKHAADLLVRLV